MSDDIVQSPDKERVPVVEVLPGLQIHPLDPGDEWLFAHVLIKYRDADGEGWAYRTSASPNREELLGALMTQTDLLRKELVDEWRD